MTTVLVTSTSRLPNNSILVKSGIVKPWDSTATTRAIADEAAVESNISYRMDLNMLESYFQGLNKQIYDQKCAVALNVSEQTYRQELTKRQELMTKVDSCMGDINMIRDFIFNEGHSALAHNDRLHLLRSEIENLKMQFRRLELQNAESLELFSRMKMNEQRVLQVEAEMKDMKKNDISESLRVNLENLRNECEGKFDQWDQYKARHIEAKFHDMQHIIEDNIEERLKSLETKVDEVTNDLNAIFDDAANEQAEKDAMLNNILNGSLSPVPMDSQPGQNSSNHDNSSHNENKSDENTSHTSGQNEIEETTHNTHDHIVHNEHHSDARKGNSRTHTIIKSHTADASHSSNSEDEDEHDVFHSAPAPMLSSQVSSTVGSELKLQAPSNSNINNTAGQMTANHSRRSSRALLKRGMSNLGGGGGGGISNEEYKGILTAMGKLQAMIQTVQSNVHRIHAMQMKFVFEKWLTTNFLNKKRTAFQKIKDYGERMHQLKVQATLRRWAKFSNPLHRIMQSFQVKEALYQWKRNVDRINCGTRLKVWLKQKLSPWYQRAQPDLSTYIERWKAFIIFSYRVQNLDRPASASPSKFGHHRVNPEEEEEEIRQLAIQNFDHTQYLHENFTITNLKQMALNELHKKWSEEEAQSKEMEKWDNLQHKFESQFTTWREQITSTTESRHLQLSHKMATFEKDYAFVTTDLRKTLTTYEENQKMVMARTEGNYQALLGEMAQIQSQVTVKFTAVTDALEDECHRLERYINQEVMTRIDHVQGESLAKDTELQQLLQQLSEHNQWKFDTLTSKNSQQDALLEAHRQQLSSHTEQLKSDTAKLTLHTEEIQHIRKTIKELSLFYDDEVNWLKQVAKESSRTFTEFKECYEKQLSETQGLLEALMSEEGSEERYTKMLTTMSSLLLKADKWYDKAALVSLQYVNSHKGHSSDGATAKVKQQYEHLFQRVRGELAAQLSRVARRIAGYIALKSEEELVMFYVERYMLQHRHDAFYHQSSHNNNKNHVNNFFDMSSSSSVVTKIDEIRGRYLLQLQRELEVTFSNAENATQMRPATAGNKVSVTAAAGLSATAAERQHRRQLLTTQFLLTVRQCLLAYPAVTTIAGLDSMLKTKAIQLLQQSGNGSGTAPAFQSNNIHINIFPNNHNIGHTKLNHVALGMTGKDAGQGGWEDTCMACQRPIVPGQYATAYPGDLQMPQINANKSNMPLSRTSTLRNEVNTMTMGMDSIMGEQHFDSHGDDMSHSMQVSAPVVLANANSGSIVVQHAKSANISPIATPKGAKQVVHSHSLASFQPHNSNTVSSPMSRRASPLKGEFRPESVVELSPGARDRLRRNETKKRRSERPFSAPANYILEPQDASVKHNFLGKHMNINTSSRILGDESRLYTPQQQAKVISEFLQTQLHRHMSLSIAAGVSMWLSMMLLMISMLSHVEEEKALVKYLIHLKDHVADAEEKDNLQNILDVVQSNRPSPTHSTSVSPFIRRQQSRAIYHWNNENEKIEEDLGKAAGTEDQQNFPPDITTAATVSSILPDNSTYLGGGKASPSIHNSWQEEGFDGEEIHADQFIDDHDFRKSVSDQIPENAHENEHDTVTFEGSSAIVVSQSQSLALESRGGFHH